MKEIREVLDKNIKHYYCEDTYYSCPKAQEGNPAKSSNRCDCGRNKTIISIESEIKKIVLGWVGSDEDNPCGRDCECSAHSEDECGCGVDWTNNRGKNALRAEIRKKIEGEL